MLSTPQLRLTKRRNSLTHPEPKSAGPDGAPCSRSTVGLLQRQPVIGTRVIYTGKESNRLEDVESGNIGLWDEIRATYADPRTFRRYVIPILKIISCSEL